MLVTKDFKTIDEQIAILDSRHLKFKNKKKAAELLSQYNYFDVINGFESILLKKNSPNKEYVGKYENPPFWVAIKALPFGSLYYTFVFLDDTVKEKVLEDFELSLSDAYAFEQALFVLKEMRNQCAHLELITRFKLKSRRTVLNRFNDIREMSGLARGDLSYLDVLKILNTFVQISDIKRQIFFFYLNMSFKGRKKIADKALSKMGRKKLSVWMKL